MRKLIAANWKMNKTLEEAISFVNELKQLITKKNADVVVCVPFTLLHDMVKLLRDSNIKLGAQNMHYEGAGAFTGEISPFMLKDAGCEYVIIGHSERRELFHEDDPLINKKVFSALNHSIKPILCVGENLEQQKQGKTRQILESQLKNCLKGISKEKMVEISVAYEPIWAISKGNPNHKAATPQDAEEGHEFIRNVIKGMYDKKTAMNTRVVYGGSMKPENAKELLSMPNIDGGLVGNASLNAKSFADIVNST